MIVDVQVNQATVTWPQAQALARRAEAGGFGAVWVFDHLAGVALGGDSMLEAFTLLGALAATTTTIELGTMVANVHNRTPALLATAAATVDAIAGRPFHLGLGSGTSPGSRWAAEMVAAGQAVEPDAAVRTANLRRTLDTLDRLWSPARGAELATFPRPRHGTSVIIGASGTELAALAGARADGLNVDWTHPRRQELLDVAVAARGGREGFELSAWTPWDDTLLDPDSPAGAEARRTLDRLVLVAPREPERVADGANP